MKYSVDIEGFEGQKIEAVISVWTGPKLVVNGEPAPKGTKRGEMTLRRNDGREVMAGWRQQFVGFDVPRLILDGKIINLVEPLKWYQWIWGGLPILLVFLGGALGAFAGIVGFSVNAKIFRTSLSEILKYLVTALVSIVTAAAYFGIAALLYEFIR